jgi:hypothetical protein
MLRVSITPAGNENNSHKAVAVMAFITSAGGAFSSEMVHPSIVRAAMHHVDSYDTRYE